MGGTDRRRNRSNGNKNRVTEEDKSPE